MRDFIETSVGSSSAADKIDRFNFLETNEANVEKITVLDVMNATSSNEAVAKLVKIWENKNAQRAVRGAGLATMALSLAACGSDSDDDAAPVTPVEPVTPVVTPISASLTIGADAVTGTSGNDTISGARFDSMQTWNSGDTISGGDGTDTLTAVITGAVAPAAGAITGVENLVISVQTNDSEVTFSTATATGISGVTHITNMGSVKDLTLTRVTELAEITVNNVITGENTIITFADTVLSGTNDTLTLNVNGANGGINIGNSSGSGAGIENLVINASGASSTFSAADIDAAAATVTVTGSGNLDMSAAAVFPKMTTFNASEATGNIKLLLGADTVTGTTDAKSLTFGAGADTLDLGDLDPSEIGVLTVAMGAGNDTLDVDNFADTTMVLGGGDGTDTLVTAAVITAANGRTITGFETFELGENTGNQVMSDISANVFTTLRAGAATTTFSNVSSSTTTLQLKGGVATTAATFSRLVDGTADALTIKAVTATTALTGNLSIDEEETVTFDSSDYALTIAGDITSTDLTSVTLVGDNNIVLGTNAAKEFSSVKIATLDATGVTGTATVSVFAINNTSAMTVTGPASTGTFTLDTGSGADVITAGAGILDVDAGLGDDTITGGVKADVLEGEGGNDTITGGEAADYISGGAGVDRITLTETTALADEVELSVGATNYDRIIGFDFGGTATDDNLSALQATFGWNSTDGATVVTLKSAASLAAAETAGDNNVATISTNVANGTFAAFMAGTMTEATMESNVITALGLSTGYDAAAVVLVLVDDGTSTGVFKYTSGDDGTAANAVGAGEIEIMAVLDGVSDATSILAADILFA